MMRKLDLIVITVPPLVPTVRSPRMIWKLNIGGVGLTEQVITTTFAKTEQCTSPDRLNVSVRT